MLAESALVEAVVTHDSPVGAERIEKNVTSLLLATDACCQNGHLIAEVEQVDGEMPLVVCITCIELWGRREGLRDWQAHCPRCFSDAYSQGLPDLGITALLPPD